MLNKVILVGFVIDEPSISHTSTRKPMATWSLHVSRGWRDRDGDWCQVEEHIPIVLFRDCDRLDLMPGQLIAVEGHIGFFQEKLQVICGQYRPLNLEVPEEIEECHQQQGRTPL